MILDQSETVTVPPGDRGRFRIGTQNRIGTQKKIARFARKITVTITFPPLIIVSVPKKFRALRAKNNGNSNLSPLNNRIGTQKISRSSREKYPLPKKRNGSNVVTVTL